MHLFARHSHHYAQCIKDSWRVLKPHIHKSPKLVIQTGSGYDFISQVNAEHLVSIPFGLIPHFTTPSVMGHAGVMRIFELQEELIVILEGRFHSYEGKDPWEIALPIRVMAQFNPRALMITNAVGGINRNYKPGDLVCIMNHINLLGINPLWALDESLFGPRFVSMHNPYETSLYDLIDRAVASHQLTRPVHRGVYLAVPGPSFETSAEIDAFASLSADVVGMSSAIEVIAARACGIPVSGLSLVTNYACGIEARELNHEEVLEVAKQTIPDILKILNYVITHL